MATIIVAYDDNRVIGNGNKLPWHCQEDLKLFKERTNGGTVIMGRKTWDNLPDKFKPLPGRLNVVISRSFSSGVVLYPVQSMTCAIGLSSIKDAIQEGINWRHDGEMVHLNRGIFIIGGAEIYRLALKEELTDRIIVSHIPGEHEGDVKFPALDARWRLHKTTEHDTFKCLDYRKELPKDDGSELVEIEKHDGFDIVLK